MHIKVFIAKINCISYDLRKSHIYWRGSKPFQRYIGERRNFAYFLLILFYMIVNDLTTEVPKSEF